MSDNSDIEEITLDEDPQESAGSDGLEESANLDILDAPVQHETEDPSDIADPSNIADIAVPDPVAGPSTIIDTGFQVPSFVKNIKNKVVRREMIRKLQNKVSQDSGHSTQNI
jgi:hypothetical protein